jgi:hypothetical protein
MSNALNISMIKEIATALEELKDKVVFVGGATVSLYIDDPAAPTPSPSEDIDCVVEIATYGEWQKFEKLLRLKNFKDISPQEEKPKNILCRKYYLKTTVDFMPTAEKVLGMTNSWFKEGMQNKISINLPGSKIDIFIFPVIYFLASKIEAFNERGKKEDIRFSQDLEDIAGILDGRISIENDLKISPNKVKEFLRKNLKDWLKNWDIYSEALAANLAYENKEDRILRIKILLTNFINS